MYTGHDKATLSTVMMDLATTSSHRDGTLVSGHFRFRYFSLGSPLILVLD
jgi:hypothetical protein